MSLELTQVTQVGKVWQFWADEVVRKSHDSKIFEIGNAFWKIAREIVVAYPDFLYTIFNQSWKESCRDIVTSNGLPSIASCPISEGKDPVKAFEDRSKLTKLVKFPNSVGKG